MGAMRCKYAVFLLTACLFLTCRELSIFAQQDPSLVFKVSSRVAIVALSDDISVVDKRLLRGPNDLLLAKGAVVNGLIEVSGKMAHFFDAGVPFAAYHPVNSHLQFRVVRHYSGLSGGLVVKVKDGEYSQALEQVVGQAIGRYSIGFIPDESKLDGKPHELKVKVNVPPSLGKGRNVEVRARKRYVAWKNGD